MHQSHFTYAIYTAGFDYFSMFLKTTLLSWLRYCYHRCEKNDENDGLLYSKHGWMSFRKYSCYHSSFWVYIVTRFISLFFLNCCLLLLFESFSFLCAIKRGKPFSGKPTRQINFVPQYIEKGPLKTMLLFWFLGS